MPALGGSLGRREIKGLGVGIQFSITMTAALALGFLAGFAPGEGRAEPLDRLGVFAGRVIARLTEDGTLDVADFDCEPVTPGLEDCNDPVTGLSFLHLPTPEGANVSLSVVKGLAIDGKDLSLADRASGEDQLAAFKALPQTALSGRDRCALLDGATDTDGLVLGIKPPERSYPVYIVHGGLNDAALAVLDRAGGDGEILSAILFVAMKAETCKPQK